MRKLGAVVPLSRDEPADRTERADRIDSCVSALRDLWEVSACTPTDTLEKLCAMLLAGVVSDEAPLDEAREELERCCARRASARFCLCLKDSEVLLKRPVVGSLQSLDTSKRSCRTS